jgi:hypothetical protein
VLGSLDAVFDIDHVVHETVHHQRGSVSFYDQGVEVLVEEILVGLAFFF